MFRDFFPENVRSNLIKLYSNLYLVSSFTEGSGGQYYLIIAQQ